MQALWPLGNDIVDIRLANRNGSASNRRFVERVMAPEEHDACAATDDGVFWAYWAAKEAAYKCLKKSNSGLIFAHRRFVVHPETTAGLSGFNNDARGVVCHETQRVPVSWVWNDDWVHCLTENGPGRPRYRIGLLTECMQRESFVTMKRESGLSDASVVVRLLALSLLDECGIYGAQIIRESAGRRRGPPQVVRDGIMISDVDISLSHHGRYAAAAIRITDKDGSVE